MKNISFRPAATNTHHQGAAAPDCALCTPGQDCSVCHLRSCEGKLYHIQLQRQRARPEDKPARERQLRTAAGEALVAARHSVDSHELRKARPSDLITLVCDFAKLRQFPISRESAAIVELLGQELSTRSAQGALDSLSPKDLSRLAGAISQGAGPGARQALSGLAQVFLKQGALTADAGWVAQSLSLMANALARGKAGVTQAALEKLAQAIVDRDLNAEEGWNGQSLSLVANALVKSGSQNPVIETALNKLAQVIAARNLSREPAWKAQNLSMMATALGQGAGPDIQQGLVWLARALLTEERLEEKHGWNVQSLAMFASGLARGLQKDTEQPEAGPQPDDRRQQRTRDFQAALALLARTIRSRNIDTDPGWNSQHLTMVANALSKGQGPEAREALMQLARTISQRDLSCQDEWNPHHLSVTASALAKIEDEEDAQQALTCLARAIKDRDLRTEQGWLVSYIAMMTNAMGKGTGPDVEMALTRLAQLINTRDLTRRGGWSSRNMAMLANGLSKGRGQAVEEALTQLALIILPGRGWDLLSEREWSGQDMIMLANGISRGTGREADKALAQLALVVRSRRLDGARPWSLQDITLMGNALAKAEEEEEVRKAIRHLARTISEQNLLAQAEVLPRTLGLLTNALAKSSGPDVELVLTRIAQIVNDQPWPGLRQWEARILVMIIHGLGKGRGPDVLKALTRLARVIKNSRLLLKDDWTDQHLSMAANGLGKAEGVEVEAALNHLAQAIKKLQQLQPGSWGAQPLAVMACQMSRAGGKEAREALQLLTDSLNGQQLTAEAGWNARTLSMMTTAIGQDLCTSALFDELTGHLLAQAAQKPTALVSALQGFCRFSLTAAHLRVARRLLDELEALDFRPATRRQWGALLWSITLFHFASGQLQAAEAGLADSFERDCRRYLSWRSDREQDDAEDELSYNDGWHNSWACDYWHQAPRLSCRVEQGIPRPAGEPISYWQQQVFEQLKKELSGHDLQMEVHVNDFPVDIMIDGRLCVEVDGKGHFIRTSATADEQPAEGDNQRRTKDQFIDEMLHRYGYRVFRIAGAEDRDKLRAFVRQVRAAVDSLEPGEVEPAWQEVRRKKRSKPRREAPVPVIQGHNGRRRHPGPGRR